ncbi:MAG: Arm DNA-binding domain-containing protein [Deltaproteobacteria bacterium]|nr:Arm DNA-binding domain-containing protein [Deltaproteobacteria bacterium]
MKLTKTTLDRAAYKGTPASCRNDSTTWSRCVFGDDEVRGLGLRVTPAGKKSFILFYRAGSWQRQMTLGAYGVLTLQQARARACQILGAVTMEGRDPLAERKAATVKACTVAQLAERYMTEPPR